MSQSEEHIELSEMELPPDLPADEPVSAVAWPAMEEFDSWELAMKWSVSNRKEGGPKYKVQCLKNGRWEAIQSWMRMY